MSNRTKRYNHKHISRFKHTQKKQTETIEMNQILYTIQNFNFSSNDEGVILYETYENIDFYRNGFEYVYCVQDTFTSTEMLNLNSNPLFFNQPKPTFYYQIILPIKMDHGSKVCSTEFKTYVHLLDHTGVVFDFNSNFSYDSPSFSMTETHEFIHPKYKQAAYSYAVLSLYDAASFEMCCLVETPFSKITLNTENVVESMNAPYTLLLNSMNRMVQWETTTLTPSPIFRLFHHVSTCKNFTQNISSIICHSNKDVDLHAGKRAYLNQLTQVNTTSDRFRVCFTTALRLSLVANTLYTLLLENNKANILFTQRPSLFIH